jgi:hypothetical protein
LEPAFSSSAEAKEELQRISQKLSTQPKIIDMPHRPGLPDGLIAVWGDVVLTPVDASSISQLAAGRTPKLGFMVDFITDFQRSAKVGLPIYRVGGGAGLILAVSYGKPDRGTFRLIAVDASKFSSPLAEQSPQGPVVAQQPPATDQAPAPAAVQPSPAQNKVAIATQPSPIVAQPLSQQIDKENESQTNIAGLKHTISLLRAELANATTKITKLETQNAETERQLKQEAQARLSAEAAKNKTEQTMLQSQKATQLWTILADVLVGSLIALLVILAPTLWNRLKKSNIAAKLANVDQWLGHFERLLSSTLARLPKGRSRDTSMKQVAEMDVTTQAS